MIVCFHEIAWKLTCIQQTTWQLPTRLATTKQQQGNTWISHLKDWNVDFANIISCQLLTSEAPTTIMCNASRQKWPDVKQTKMFAHLTTSWLRPVLLMPLMKQTTEDAFNMSTVSVSMKDEDGMEGRSSWPATWHWGSWSCLARSIMGMGEIPFSFSSSP